MSDAATRQRQRRRYRRQCAGLSVAPVEYGPDVAAYLITEGLLPADAASDRTAVGKAVAEAIKIITRRNYPLQTGISQAGQIGDLLRLMNLDRRAV